MTAKTDPTAPAHKVTAEQWADLLARLELDPQSIELITAFLTADVCDGIEPVED
ncbi:MAG: hypothetical protein ACRDYV_10200 [Acidimicrobiia bacterium]